MKIARLAGVDIRINQWLVLMSALYVWAGVGPQVALAFLCVAWHELGHSIAARRAGFSVQEIEFFPFGGVARISPGLEQSPRDEIMVALAGPVFSFILVIMLDAGLMLGMGWNDSVEYLRNVNFTLGAFNLLPILPLDGGRVFRSLLTTLWGAMKASQQAALWGEGMALLFGFLSIIGLYWQKSGLDLPLIAGFLFLGAHKERTIGPMVFWRLLKAKRQNLSTKKTWSGDVVVAREDVHISNLLPQIVPDRCMLITVIDKGGHIVGQVSESDLLSHMMQGNEDMPVGDLIRKA
ncbi:site-2 protease family protein [Heliobacterium chlorum]|uniref:Site-2 protease family protein n=1 Tax=Heliobacterium chlorum TaxID=2698 RepID=A0ABR7T1L4_HELCL|nr:site-2 protease family protein [Heliobacterium chlorum]MBC9783893.1 site-2 protease family protein [Heliobacterium chlorum]